MPNVFNIKLEELVLRLEAEREELLSLSDVAREARAPVDLDQSRQGRLSRMDAMQQRAMAQETARRRQLRLAQVEAALQRVVHREYGFCATCDEDIEPARLALDPATAFCLAHAK